VSSMWLVRSGGWSWVWVDVSCQNDKTYESKRDDASRRGMKVDCLVSEDGLGFEADFVELLFGSRFAAVERVGYGEPE